jgi:hypothetical protein
MKKFSIPGIDENDIEFYTGHTGCVKIKNATQYSAGNYSCYVEIRTFDRKFVGSETIGELVSFSAGDLSSNNLKLILLTFGSVFIFISFLS